MYRLYLKQNGEQLLLPVTPAEIETRTGNQNKTAYILDFGEMNLAKKPGLTEIRFTALLPGRAYSFVQTEGGFREPEYFLNRFKEYKASAKPVQMILFRRLADGKQKFCGNTEVLLEEYTVTEKGGEQGDFWVEFFWKEWRAAKSIRYSIQGNSMMAQGQAGRQSSLPPAIRCRGATAFGALRKSSLEMGRNTRRLRGRTELRTRIASIRGRC